MTAPCRASTQARFTARRLESGFATGVTIVTALEDGEPVGFTCQAFDSLSLDPPLVALAPAKSSTSWPRIAEAGAFCVNILAEHQEALCRDFAVSGGDKFDGRGLAPGRPTARRCSTGALAWVECELELVHDAGDHELVIGQGARHGRRRGSAPRVLPGRLRPFEPYPTGRLDLDRSGAAMPERSTSVLEVIADVVVVEPDVHGDERGRFVETYRRELVPARPRDDPGQPLREAGRRRRRPALPPPPGRLLVRAAGDGPGRAPRPAGRLAHRRGDPGARPRRRTTTRACSSRPGSPTGSPRSPTSSSWYLVDNYYNPADELGVAWDDPAVGADWGVSDPVLSPATWPTRSATTFPTTSARAWPADAGSVRPPDSAAGRSIRRVGEAAARGPLRILLNMGWCGSVG